MPQFSKTSIWLRLGLGAVLGGKAVNPMSLAEETSIWLDSRTVNPIFCVQRFDLCLDRNLDMARFNLIVFKESEPKAKCCL